jgi:hypothetical protein
MSQAKVQTTQGLEFWGKYQFANSDVDVEACLPVLFDLGRPTAPEYESGGGV